MRGRKKRFREAQHTKYFQREGFTIFFHIELSIIFDVN